MPDEPGDNLLSSIKKFLSDFSLIEQAKKLLAKLRALAKLPGFELLDLILAAIAIMLLRVSVLLLYRSLLLSFTFVAIAGAIMLLLIWRERSRHKPADKAKKRLSDRQQFAIKTALTILVLVVVGFFAAHLYKTHQFHKELKNSGLPPDLYDRQGQLESLTIEQPPQENQATLSLDWLDSTTLTSLTLHSPNLISLDGLANAPHLQSLDVDLTKVDIDSVSAISSLGELKEQLVLRNIGRNKKPLNPEVIAFPHLTSLDLDYERFSGAELPRLKASPELHDLALNLRSTTGIFQPPDISELKHLLHLKLFLDNSRVQSLKPVDKATGLHTLTLSLDGTQLDLLKDLNDGPGVYSLNLVLTSPPNSPFPSLSGIHKLISLSLQMPGSRGDGLPDRTPVPDITYLSNLQALGLSLAGSEVRALPEVGRLTQLRILRLDLGSSSVEKLPNIVPLQDLEQLWLDLSHTKIPDLPNFAQSSMPGAPSTPFPKLKELTLHLAGSKISSLNGIEHLANLTDLELDIRNAKIRDLDSITKLGTLKKLVLYLNWSQVRDIPDLSPLKNLDTLELHIDAYWPNEQLPRLSNLEKLTTLKLVAEASDIKDWTPLEQLNKLVNVELDLSGSAKIPPALHVCKQIGRVAADLRHTGANLGQTGNLCGLQELTIDPNAPSLEGLPESVKGLVIGP